MSDPMKSFIQIFTCSHYRIPPTASTKQGVPGRASTAGRRDFSSRAVAQSRVLTILPIMKGVIVTAGYGTRFLPVTKTIPKEMLPLVTRPSIEFIVDELVASGITEILFITSRRKKSLEDYFDREAELESVFRAAGDAKKLQAIAPPKARCYFVRQQEMRGTGH